MPRGKDPIGRQKLKADIEAVAEAINDTPTLGQYKNQGEHSAGAVYNEFGSWNDALEACNLGINEQHSKDPVIVECATCGTELEKHPSEVENAEYNYCSQECHYEHKQDRYSGDGNPRWNKKEVECDVCGEKILRADWERDRYKRTYCSDCWGDATVTITCEWCGDQKEVWPSHNHENRRFCSKSCLGEWKSENVTGEDHPRWKPGEYPDYYGPNWFKKRRQVLKRDQFRCQECGITQPDHILEYAEGLTVHHKTPMREFSTDNGHDYEQANRLENLQTVCRACHIKVERRS